jgi:POT family proton-dependent oligopeptide transporter
VPDPAPKTAAAAVSTEGPIQPPAGEFLGHPKGLYVLFSTELWERFSFYSMRGIMTLYMVSVVLAVMTAAQGAEASGGFADQVYGAYLGFVYSATFIGGMLADRLLGQRRAIYIGGFLMSLAHFTLTTHAVLVNSAFKPGELNFLFFVGLGLLCCGNGFFKPNISTIVGTLYSPEDARRDGAFTIFYMGINIGAMLSSFSSGIAQKWGWYIAYLLAGIGMIVSLAIMFAGRGWIAGRGLPPAGARLVARGRLGVPNAVPLVIGILVFVPLAAYMLSRPELVQDLARWVGVGVLFYLMWEAARTAPVGGHRTPIHLVAVIGGITGLLALLCQTLTDIGSGKLDAGLLVRLAPLLHWAAICFLVAAAAGLAYLVLQASRSQEGGRMFVTILLCAFSMVFWGFYELQGSTIIRFADLYVSMSVFKWQVPTTWFANFVNPFLIIVLGIPFAWVWVWLDRKRLEPSTPLKFSLGLAQLALGFLVLWIAAAPVQHGGKGSLTLLMLGYLLFTTGELCLSPVGLSMVTKLAPARLVGVFMGLWFLAPAIGNVFTGGAVGPLTKQHGFAPVFLGIAGVIGGAAVLLLLLTPLLKRQMHGIK